MEDDRTAMKSVPFQSLSLSNRLAEADPEIGHDVQTIKRRLANFTHLGRQSPPHCSFLGIIGSMADTIIGDAWLEHARSPCATGVGEES